ncbi:hypothetical protein LPJ53_005978 [Coemansia erecta]|uniref:Uncharacterized protein n=1 Tax=Coemansia erecta TaxID=147472 RepID=A0A9W7XVK9_9FUNG|nr:hypothetical protein LPJ53_005978 [Coemansia erecta]
MSAPQELPPIAMTSAEVAFLRSLIARQAAEAIDLAAQRRTSEAMRAMAKYEYSGVNGKTPLIDYIAAVETNCELYLVEQEPDRPRVAICGLAASVQRQWTAQKLLLAKEGVVPTSASLVAFLRSQFEPLCSEAEAIADITELRFIESAPGADFATHNRRFDELLARVSDTLPPRFLMGLYRATLPQDYKVAAAIQKADTLQSVREAASLVWNAFVKTPRIPPPISNSGNATVEYMDVDRLVYDNSLPCSHDEFNNRLRAGLCAYCGRGKHTISQCSHRRASSNATTNTSNGQSNGNNSRRNRKKKLQVNAVTTTEAATPAALANPTPQENPSQGNF